MRPALAFRTGYGHPLRKVSVTSSASPEKPSSKQHLERLKGDHKPIGLVAMSAVVLSSATQLSGEGFSPSWLPIAAGAALGALFFALNRAGIKHVWKEPKAPLRVVITGGSKGIGKALAREFLRRGDNVLITSRSQSVAEAAAATAVREAGISPYTTTTTAFGVACDVSDAQAVEALVEATIEKLGGCDCWINNAGYSGSFQSLMHQDPETIEQVVRTNLLGSLFCTRAAMRLMSAQPSGGGHVFNMEGAGSDGAASPGYAAYGATKAAIAQIRYSIIQNKTQGNSSSEIGTPFDAASVRLHNLSPGMVLTDLLLEGATLENKLAFNILCEQPETIAAFLVPRVRTVVARGLANQRIRYLTSTRLLTKIASAPFRRWRFFDEYGNAVYPSEHERLMGQYQKRTERLARAAACRSAGLGLVYGASVAMTYLILVVDEVARAHSSSVN